LKNSVSVIRAPDNQNYGERPNQCRAAGLRSGLGRWWRARWMGSARLVRCVLRPAKSTPPAWIRRESVLFWLARRIDGWLVELRSYRKSTIVDRTSQHEYFLFSLQVFIF
jgi:hypothetical protein